MAEEITVNQVESEIIELEVVDEKENPIEFEDLIITKGPPKILSRYRRERRSSCHDLCKYGIPHATEEKPWKTAKKRRERKTNVSGEILTSLEGTKKSGRSSVSDPDFPVDIKEVITSEKTATSEKNSPPFEEIDVSMEHNNSDVVQPSSETSSHHVKHCPKSRTKWEVVKNKCAFGSSSIKETAIRSKQEGTSSSGGKDKSSASSFLSSTKQNVKNPSSSSDTSKNLRRVSTRKNHENGEEIKPELANNDNLPEKILHVIEPNSENLSEEATPACDATKSPSPLPSSPGDKNFKRTTKKTGNSGVSASSRKGLRHVGQGTVSGTLSHQSSGNKFETNIQHQARSASRSSSRLSIVSSSNSSSLRKQIGTTYKPNKTGHSNQGENVKAGYKIRPKMTTIVGAANNVIPTRKLTFRRGKVIETQPQSNNIARRLKFRPVRRLGDDIRRDVNGTRKITVTDKVDGGELHSANNKTEKVDLKQQTVERIKNGKFGRRISGVDRNRIYGSKSGSEKVVLKHQNMEWRKKQNPGLYNNVIEETASKLTELRKSKVKALVGAFETVISLDSPREGATATHAEVNTLSPPV
ncbi:hypothetical protein TSUD_208790 [Trifolium subterraneum]|uniref:Calmodulin-binding domain-containing protein n=1 Tax=Trifolium subterraneum TaxID=3900 RepID=A0A2Z6M3C2_TRISU|nr:hypothetical protein TSUD_208790 [Trifolium subterraneum]